MCCCCCFVSIRLEQRQQQPSCFPFPFPSIPPSLAAVLIFFSICQKMPTHPSRTSTSGCHFADNLTPLFLLFSLMVVVPFLAGPSFSASLPLSFVCSQTAFDRFQCGAVWLLGGSSHWLPSFAASLSLHSLMNTSFINLNI